MKMTYWQTQAFSNLSYFLRKLRVIGLLKIHVTTLRSDDLNPNDHRYEVRVVGYEPNVYSTELERIKLPTSLTGL